MADTSISAIFKIPGQKEESVVVNIPAPGFKATLNPQILLDNGIVLKHALVVGEKKVGDRFELVKGPSFKEVIGRPFKNGTPVHVSSYIVNRNGGVVFKNIKNAKLLVDGRQVGGAPRQDLYHNLGSAGIAFLGQSDVFIQTGPEIGRKFDGAPRMGILYNVNHELNPPSKKNGEIPGNGSILRIEFGVEGDYSKKWVTDGQADDEIAKLLQQKGN